MRLAKIAKINYWRMIMNQNFIC